VSATEPEKVYPQWPVSFSTVPYSDHRSLIEPEVGVIVPRQSHVNGSHHQFRATHCGVENCSLALHIPKYGSENGNRMRQIYNRCVVLAVCACAGSHAGLFRTALTKRRATAALYMPSEGVSCLPVGLSARGAQGGLLVRRDECTRRSTCRSYMPNLYISQQMLCK